MGKSQFVLEDGFAVGENLNLIGEGIESIRHSLCQMQIGHAWWPATVGEILKMKGREEGRVCSA